MSFPTLLAIEKTSSGGGGGRIRRMDHDILTRQNIAINRHMHQSLRFRTVFHFNFPSPYSPPRVDSFYGAGNIYGFPSDDEVCPSVMKKCPNLDDVTSRYQPLVKVMFANCVTSVLWSCCGCCMQTMSHIPTLITTAHSPRADAVVLITADVLRRSMLVIPVSNGPCVYGVFHLVCSAGKVPARFRSSRSWKARTWKENKV